VRLFILGQSLQSPSTRSRGIGRYARNLLIGLHRVRPDWRLTVIEVGHLPPIDRGRLPSDLEFVSYQTSLPLRDGDRATRWANDQCFTTWLQKREYDALLAPCATEGDGVMPHGSAAAPPLAVVLHDLIPVIYPELNLMHPVWTDHYSDRLQLLREADLTLANSESTARDFRRLMPHARSRTVVIGGATDEEFAVATSPAASRWTGEKSYLLYIGGDCWRKNGVGMVEAYAALPRPVRGEFDLVIACRIPADMCRRLCQRAARLGVSDSVRLTGSVTDAELRELYRGCRLAVMPSLYEGLGLPLLEALLCGAPVVTSDVSSMPEYAGPGAQLADPLDPNAVARAVLAALRQPREQGEAERIAFARSHSAERMAAKLANALEHELPTRSRPRPTLAWVMHRAPKPDEDAGWLEGLLRLGECFNIDVVIGEDGENWPAAWKCRFPCIRAEQFAARASLMGYAHVVHHVAREPRGPALTTRIAAPETVIADLPSCHRSAGWASLLDRAQAVAVTSPEDWFAWRRLIAAPVVHVPRPTILSRGAIPFAERLRGVLDGSLERVANRCSGG
jgi:glycosyltransferase involved in cell wall biosynthesis